MPSSFACSRMPDTSEKITVGTPAAVAAAGDRPGHFRVPMTTHGDLGGYGGRPL